MTELCVDVSSIYDAHMDQFASGAVNAYKVHFTFSDDWADLIKTVTFRAGDVSKSIILGADLVCDIPWEVLQNYSRVLEVGVEGRNSETIIIPTIWKRLRIIEPGSESEKPDIPPTLDWYDQVMKELSKIPQPMTEEELEQLLDDKVIAHKNIFMNSDRTREFWNAIKNYVDQNGGSGDGSVEAGVLSFNGRTGHVISRLGDYDHSMVGMEPLTNTQLEAILK